MNTLLKILLASFILINVSYADDLNTDDNNTNMMEDEEYNYEENSSNVSVETYERSEYELEFKNYVTARYTSSKTIIEK